MTSTVLLVDAMSIAYRAFHAISGLSTADGRPTNAVFGFIKTLGRVERLWSPTHRLVVFDGGIPRSRLDLLPSYKSQRPPMPDSLRKQLDDIVEYLDCMSIRHMRMEGEEADDVIATVVERSRAAGVSVLIMTGDKDLMQLVNDDTGILFPSAPEIRTGRAEVIAKTGVRPDQVVAWLALIGDNSDNIPGVPGVGPGTAARWLNEWDSLEAILEHVEELKPARLRPAVLKNKDVLERNTAMMTLDRKLGMTLSLDDMKKADPDFDRLLRFYRAMEFHSLERDLKAPSLF